MVTRSSLVLIGLFLTATTAAAQTVDFTVVTAALVADVKGDTNVKVADYVYFVDPLNRALTMAGAAIHVAPYDRKLPKPTLAERFAILAAGAITPAGGFGVGASVMVVRGFAVNGGMAWLLVNAARNGAAVAAVPADLAHPFETGIAHAWFVGANYTFHRPM